MNVLVEQAFMNFLVAKHAKTLTSVKNKDLVTIPMGSAKILKGAIGVLVNLDLSYNPTERLALVNCFLKFQ